MPPIRTSRRGAGTASLLVLPLLALIVGCSRRPELPKNPPILLLTVDTLRADHLSTYGYARTTSPSLDSIAAEGVRFDFALSQWPKTGPSFASIMTSTYPKDNHVVRRVGIEVPCRYRLLAEELRNLGYDTRAVVANGALGREFCFDQGFADYQESWKGARGEAQIEIATRADRVTALALASLDRRDSSKPLFLWVHYLDPHFPYRPPDEVRDRFQDDGLLRTGKRVPIDRGSRKRFDGAIGASQVLDGRDELDFYVARYDAEIAFVDREIGRLLDGLRQRGLYDRMLTVMTSDHGESLGEHGYYFGHGMYPFQDGLRVPLLVRFPGVVEPGVDAAPVPLLDLSPTLLEAAGAPLEEHRWAQGVSLLDRIWGRRPPRSAEVYSEAGYALNRRWMKIVTDGRLKLIWIPAAEEQRKVLGAGHDFALYDLKVDPGELHDLTAERPEELARLQRLLRGWFQAPRFQLARDPDDCGERSETAPETIEQLKALGYL